MRPRGLRARIEARVNAAASHADVAIAQGQNVLAKYDVLGDELIELVERLQTEGLEFSLKIGDRELPVVLCMKAAKDG